MILNVYGKTVFFSEAEEKMFREIGLDLNDGFMELLLYWNEIDGFEENSSDEERHRLCIEAIKAYRDLTISTLKCAEREGLV